MTYLILIITVIVAYYGYKFWKGKKRREERQKMFEKLTSDYDMAFEEGNIQRIQNTARELINFPFVSQGALDVVYQQGLSLLKQNPDLKPLVLEMGRKKYSKFRYNGSPTVYDESAILNDINAAL